MKYNAFLSYSQRQDSKLGPCLETALEKFAKPTFKRRALEIFRDSNDLSASPDLWGKIEDALNESEFFIFLASPLASNSRWCKKEVDHWRKKKSFDNFLVVVTDGEIVWDEARVDFDWTRTTALPQNLSGAFKNEPLYVDFRDDPPAEELTLDHPEFSKRLVILAATLHKKAVGDMVGESIKQFKRTMFIGIVAISALSLLLGLAVVLSIYANDQRIEAESETRKALLSSYIASSQGQLAEDPTISLRLAEYAYGYAKKNGLDTKQASEQLIKVFYSGYGFYQQTDDQMAEIVANENDQDNSDKFIPFRQKTADFANTVGVHEYLGDKAGPFQELRLDSQSNKAEFVIAGGTLDIPRLYLLRDGGECKNQDEIAIQLDGFHGLYGHVTSVAISSDGHYSLFGAANNKTALIDNDAYCPDSSPADVFKTRYILHNGGRGRVGAVGFSSDDEYIITEGSNIRHWKTDAFPYIEIRNAPVEHNNVSVDEVHYMIPDDDDLEEYTWFHYAQTVYDRQGTFVAKFPDAKGLSIFEDRNSVNTSNSDFSLSTVGIYNKEGDLLITIGTEYVDNPGVAYSYSLDGNYFKLSYLDGLERIFALDPESISARINDPAIMGSIAQLTNADKERFLIEDVVGD